MNKHSDIVAEHWALRLFSTTSGNGSTASPCGDRTFSAAAQRLPILNRSTLTRSTRCSHSTIRSA